MRKTALGFTMLILPFLTSCAVVQVGATNTPPKPAQVSTTFETLNDEYVVPARGWDKAETERQIAGKTFLRNYPGKQNEVLYFDSNNVVYQWLSGGQSVASSTWAIDFLSQRPGQTAKLFICTHLINPIKERSDHVPRRCIDPALLFIPATEHAEGDVFSIAGKIAAPGVFSVERTTIENIRKQLMPTK